jgi:hypothetical protein
MFKQHTVIVIGAGAGVEYGMPLGSKLVTDIADAVRFRFDRYNGSDPNSGDYELFQMIYRQLGGNREEVNKFTVAGNALASVLSSANSIDDALYQLGETPEAVTLGKMCIMRSILKAEGASTIRLSERTAKPAHESGRDGWVEQIFSMAISGLKQSQMEFAFDKLTFVNFNYDRCLEHYVYWALRRIGLEEDRSVDIVRDLKIIRPYGGLGSILSTENDFVAYGGATDLFKAIPRIRTFTESDAIHDGSKLEVAIRDAHLVMFLGFGFHAQNMDLLKVRPAAHRRVMATVKKVHPENKIAIAAEIRSKLSCEDPNKIELHDMTAPEMLRELRPKIQLTVS